MDSNEYDLELYPEIESYLGEFQVENRRPISEVTADLESLMTVFRRKNISEFKPGSDNIYSQNLSYPDLDKSDPNKARSSCVRCHRLKKKCSRELPECTSCGSSEKLCVYLSRKGRKENSLEKEANNKKKRLATSKEISNKSSTRLKNKSKSKISIEKTLLTSDHGAQENLETSQNSQDLQIAQSSQNSQNSQNLQNLQTTPTSNTSNTSNISNTSQTKNFNFNDSKPTENKTSTSGTSFERRGISLPDILHSPSP